MKAFYLPSLAVSTAAATPGNSPKGKDKIRECDMSK